MVGRVGFAALGPRGWSTPCEVLEFEWCLTRRIESYSTALRMAAAAPTMHFIESCRLTRSLQVVASAPLLYLFVGRHRRPRTAAPVRHRSTKQRLRHTVGTPPRHGPGERRRRARS